ncbi:hypothetical protein FBQ85_25730, partial [Cytophagia bacterium CHB2]|nr:hypothetical protein [Cytophagia bacterium CHB2]
MRHWLHWFMASGAGAQSPRKVAVWILGFVVAVFAGLAGRLYSLQVMHHEDYLEQRNRSSTRTITLPGER